MGGEIQTVEQSFLWEGTKHNQFKQFSGIQTLLVTNPFEGSTAFENNSLICINRHTLVSFEVLNEKWNSVLFLFYLWEKHENFIYVIIENVKIWKTSLTQSNSMGLKIRTK